MRTLTVLLASLALCACGARTPLDAPDLPDAPPDARDATAPDAPRDARPREAGLACVADPNCSDNIDCTIDRCDLTAHRCLAPEPSDLRCPVSHTCDPSIGCVAQAFAHGPTGLYGVRPPLGTVLQLGSLPPGLTDLALAPDRTLYAVSHDLLYRIDGQGLASVVGAPTADLTALDVAPDGTLYAGGAGVLYRLDRDTADARAVGTYPAGFEASGDLAFLRGRLLGTAAEAASNQDSLVEFDLAAGTARVLGRVGFTCVWGLAALGDTLYGFTCDGYVLRVDPNTGAATMLARAGARFYGATAR